MTAAAQVPTQTSALTDSRPPHWPCRRSTSCTQLTVGKNQPGAVVETRQGLELHSNTCCTESYASIYTTMFKCERSDFTLYAVFRGKDHLFFQNAQRDKEEVHENQMPITNRSENSQTAVKPLNQPTNDVLSGLFKHLSAVSVQKHKLDCWRFL